LKRDPSPRIAARLDVLARANAARVFQDGPFARVLALLPGARVPNRGIENQAITVAVIAWVPLLLAALAQDSFTYGASVSVLLVDFGVHARYLVALPLLVLADRFCGNRLTAVAYCFQDAGLVRTEDVPRFDALVATTRRRCASGWIATLTVFAAYAVLGALLAFLPPEEIPAWHRLAQPRSPSPAGWWHLLVSAPLLLALSLAWLWRLLVWTWFLWRTAYLPIRLCAAHPDHAAGLKFVGFSVRAFAPLGAAFGAVLGGRIANHVWDGTRLATYDTTVGAAVVAVLLIFGAPLFAFTPRMMREWRDGVYLYGRLAGQVGFRFEEKWFRETSPVDAEALHASDFSAATDLSGYASNVYDMRVTPADLKSFIALAVATVLPLLPVVLIAAPFDVLMKSIAGLLF
jgi:hypothetical protein